MRLSLRQSGRPKKLTEHSSLSLLQQLATSILPSFVHQICAVTTYSQIVLLVTLLRPGDLEYDRRLLLALVSAEVQLRVKALTQRRPRPCGAELATSREAAPPPPAQQSFAVLRPAQLWVRAGPQQVHVISGGAEAFQAPSAGNESFSQSPMRRRARNATSGDGTAALGSHACSSEAATSQMSLRLQWDSDQAQANSTA